MLVAFDFSICWLVLLKLHEPTRELLAALELEPALVDFSREEEELGTLIILAIWLDVPPVDL